MPGTDATPSSLNLFDRPFYVDAGPLASKHLTGIGRYTARLALALARRGRVRFFADDTAIETSAKLDWSEDQDLAVWARKVWRSRRARLRPETDAVAIHTCLRSPARRFGVEVSVVHDLTPLLLPETHLPATIRDFQGLYARSLLSSDLVLADSHATRADAAWLCEFPENKVWVGHPGGSLCVHGHLHTEKVERRPNVGFVVATLEPRKNARFLIDWFADSDVIPEGSELWWVGPTGWKTSRKALSQARIKGGRSIRFLNFVDDKTLCRLYQTAGWMAYPSLYEGFGFPVLDALRHGMPVLAAGNSSLREFTGQGIGFFDPLDPASLDHAFVQMQAGQFSKPEPLAQLEQRFSWDRLLDVLGHALSAHLSAETPQPAEARAA